VKPGGQEGAGKAQRCHTRRTVQGHWPVTLDSCVGIEAVDGGLTDRA
jgi:hypothetical protein